MAANEEFVDELDLQILTLLQQDSDATYREIAKRLGVSHGTISNRIHRLVESGTLMSVFEINPFHVGLDAPALINVKVDHAHLLEAAEAISRFPEVRWLGMVTGESDLVIDVTCRDTDHLFKFITEKLGNVHGVRDIRTSTYIRVFKSTGPDVRLVLDEPLPEEGD
jgi:Lrp/AsnC family transcriptional regulator for asnA, asnC and gidA